MKRKFLYEIVEDLQTSNDLRSTLIMYLDKARGFRELVDIIYNPRYKYEFDKNVMKTKARSQRENGGFSTAWLDVVKVFKAKLIHSTNLSSRLPDYYAKACLSCNQKDVDILNYAVSHRNFPGFQGTRKKMIVSIIKEYYGESYGDEQPETN